MQHLENGYILHDRYKIVRYLHSGGFGCIYEVEQIDNHQRMAVKEFFAKDYCKRNENGTISVENDSNTSTVNQIKEKFLEEAETLAAIHHPNIVHVTDSFEDNGTYYYVMDYIEGLSLDEIVKLQGRLPESKALRYIHQIANALDYAHRMNRLHLDVKPSNIMINANDDAILIDFGISKPFLTVESGVANTTDGKSPGYSPVEQLGNDNNSHFLLPATDIYALGATLYKLLTGDTPPTASVILQNGLTKLPRNISLATRNAILAAMQPDQKNRPQCIYDFLFLLNAESQSDDERTLVNNAIIKGKKPAKGRASKKPFTIAFAIIGALVLLSFGIHRIISHFTPSPDKAVPDKRTVTVNGLSFDMVKIGGGSFIMGSTYEQHDESDTDEEPTHEVFITTFYMGEVEVTQALWATVMGDSIPNPKEAMQPKVNVSWDDCQVFIKKLNEQTGWHFKLPTEAEWEYAARGGQQSCQYKYAGSNTLERTAWFANNSKQQTHNVGQKQPNELGLYDMSGNVWEWCYDLYGRYQEQVQYDPIGSTSGEKHVVRGGSHASASIYCRVSLRNAEHSDSNKNDIGFRLSCPETDITTWHGEPSKNLTMTFSVNGCDFNMKAVTGGTFDMGATPEHEPDAFDKEKPVHKVTLSSYLIGETEVTQRLWTAVMGNNPAHYINDNAPVENVSWNDCQSFIEQLNAITGMSFRLPTEAEWEYAARGGAERHAYRYAGSDNPYDVAWCYEGSNDDWEQEYKTHNNIIQGRPRDVATKVPNELGLYDMSGNVWEWCDDDYLPYSAEEQTNPVRHANTTIKLLRGGSFLSKAVSCRIAARGNSFSDDKSNFYGFRLAMDAPDNK